MASIDQEHLLFRTKDGRACRLFIPALIWEDDETFEEYYKGSVALWLRHELISEGESEDDFDINEIAYNATIELAARRPEWHEIRELVGLAAQHGVGEPARLLRSRAPEERDWLIPGLIAAGGVTLVGGREKLSGKSTLLFNLIGALERNEPTFFGDAYGESVKTLVITEEPEYAIVDKLNTFNLNDAWVVQDWAWPLDKVPGDGMQAKWVYKLEQIEILAHAVGARHVIIDPLSRIAAVEDEAGRELGTRAEAISSMAYRSGLAVTLIHHNNKASGTAVEDKMRGSTSLTAAVDQIVQIEKRSKRSPRQRFATSYGRVEESNWEKAFELGDDATSYVEVDAEAEAEEDLKEDVGLIQTAGGEVTIKSFCEHLNIELTDSNRQKTRTRLNRLADQGLVEMDKNGRERVYRVV